MKNDSQEYRGYKIKCWRLRVESWVAASVSGCSRSSGPGSPWLPDHCLTRSQNARRAALNTRVKCLWQAEGARIAGLLMVDVSVETSLSCRGENFFFTSALADYIHYISVHASIRSSWRTFLSQITWYCTWGIVGAVCYSNINAKMQVINLEPLQ